MPRFGDPWLLLLLVVPIGRLLARWIRRPGPRTYVAFPMLPLLDDAGSRRVRWRWLPLVCETAALCLLVGALARPQLPHAAETVRTRSRNIVLALDISSSMKAADFRPGNRLTVARRVLADFVRRREGDLMGLVVFAGRAFLQVPLTPDARLVGEMLERVDIGMLPDGTAIGTALALSLGQLKDLPAEASAIVLLTDGANNTGKPTPAVAAEAARALGIRIHAIGVSAADSLIPDSAALWRAGRTPDRLTGADEAALRRIAERTGGRYFRATDPGALERVVAAIEPLERTEVTLAELRDYRELYAWLLAPGLLLLGLQLVLRATWLRTTP
ncbi:MAG TPA: VWA domain-containing protein [Gemmatimonadales bacterium]|nr:VWA domain-containing protein [Gemmatimonadales bacterium]